jgi:Asp-tRNA(Asn)/Glu-tRNA(Gln) amidotransferase A subunit family amidase
VSTKREPSAAEWLARLAAGDLSARELVDHYFDRIDAVNPSLNAVVGENRELVGAHASEADRLRRAGDRRPLLGLPVTIKDALDVVGFAAVGGSFAREGFRPGADATVVARLRAAGAIPLAKTNVPEYTWSFECGNPVHGRANNPRDPARTPGGSSGGEGAILGADASPVGVGSDGGGSIRVPSHYCGIVGLRPTAGRVPETGHWPRTRSTGMLDMCCVGPMARSVEDLALLLPILAGPDDVDPFAVPAPLGDWRSVELPSLRVAFYEQDGLAPVTEPTREAVQRAANTLAARGSEVSAAIPPGVADATALFFAAMAADGGARARADLAAAGDRLHPDLRRLLDELEPTALDAAGLLDVLARLFELRSAVRRFLAQYDVVVCPVAAGPAPLHGGWPGESVGSDSYDAFNYTHTYSVAGAPVVVVPAGEEDGMPIGVQLVARPFHEHVTLAAAAALEAELGGFTPPPAAG